MPYIRRLPSGLWQATVRRPDGSRYSETGPLRQVVKNWALQEEAAMKRGEWRDPRLGEIKVGAWYKRLAAARSGADSTSAKHASLWRTHCEPQWAKWPMNTITHMEAQEWAKTLEKTKRARHKGRTVRRGDDEDVPLLGAETVAAAVNLMSLLYTTAMDEKPPLVLVNPFAKLDLPEIAPRPLDFLEHGEAEALYAAAAVIGSQWETLVELGTEVGLRPGEIFGLHGHRVDWMRDKLTVVDVMTRTGLRRWPKSQMSHRVVPVRHHIIEGMSALMTGRSRDALVFTAPGGGPIDDGNFRDRVWYPAVEAAGIRRFPPRIMRHTAASWLVQDGVSLYKVQALLGHESFKTTQRYAHLAPDADEDIRASWARKDRDASVTHGRKQKRG